MIDYASLATIKPFGRPANRTIFCRGFLTPTPNTPVQITPNTSGTTLPASAIQSDRLCVKDGLSVSGANSSSAKETEDRQLGSVLVFVTDARSGSVEDIIHGSRFGEVNWFFPDTKESFRLSGSLSLVLAPQHPLMQQHQIPAPFANISSLNYIDWEKERLKFFCLISPYRRASFARPRGIKSDASENDAMSPTASPTRSPSLPNATSVSPSNMSRSPSHPPSNASHLTHLESMPAEVMSAHSHKPHEHASHGGTHAGTFQFSAQHTSLSSSTTSHHHQQSTLSAGAGGKDLSPEELRLAHQEALKNFCLLLVDVDGVDHVKMSTTPHQRTKYRKASSDLGASGTSLAATNGSRQSNSGTSTSSSDRELTTTSTVALNFENWDIDKMISSGVCFTNEGPSTISAVPGCSGGWRIMDVDA